MKNLQSHRLLVSLVFALLFNFPVFAQDMTQNSATKEMEVAAKNEVQKWEEELSLRSKQMVLMEKKLVEFAIKRQKLMNRNISQDEKLESLKNLKILETREIRDILTKPQFDRYLRILEQEARNPKDDN